MVKSIKKDAFIAVPETPRIPTPIPPGPTKPTPINTPKAKPLQTVTPVAVPVPVVVPKPKKYKRSVARPNMMTTKRNR